MKELKRVLVMAGGTGGHVFPGLAVAHYLREKGIEVHWLGTNQGIEARLVPEAHFPLHLVSIGGLRGKGIKTLLSAPWRIFKAVLHSKRIINNIDPDVVLGMGGFVSGPGGLASWLSRRPLIIHEQNAKAGLTNKLLANIAKRVLVGFPTAFPFQSKAIMIGNPVRPEIEALPSPQERLAPRLAAFAENQSSSSRASVVCERGCHCEERFVRRSNPDSIKAGLPYPEKNAGLAMTGSTGITAFRLSFRLLVLGGSLGAKALNDTVPRALSKLPANERPDIWHQTGEKHFDETKMTYESMGIQANVVPFVKDMAQAYSWADMVLCRAGALTVSELCAAGLGAVLVPYPFAVDDHQTANAHFMVKDQAAICIPQSELTDTRLADIVREFSRAPERRLAMAQAAYQLRQVDVAKKIYDVCKEVCS